MTDKDERMKDTVAELRFASDGIVNMLAANLTPKESFMRDLAADLSYAASAIASQAAEIERLRAHIERGHEIHERLTNFSSHSMEWDMALDEAIAYLSGDTP